MILEQGQTIYRTAGEYSDYTVKGFYRVLRTFDSDAVKAGFISLGKWPVTEPDWKDKPHQNWYGAADEFMQWLVDELYLESCDKEFTNVWCDDGNDELTFC